MQALVVVAHDDDAVLWMGGVIHCLRDWKWQIISMCNQGNEIRKSAFHEASRCLGATSHAFDFYDYQNARHVNSIDDMKATLLQVTRGNKYDYVFTHSYRAHGEYSFHANHAEVCCVVKALVNENQLLTATNHLAHFCYCPIYGAPGLATVATKDADYYFQLNYDDLAFKVDLIRLFPQDVVDNLKKQLGSPCPNPEAFEGPGLMLPTPFVKRIQKQASRGDL